jgi:hypothetical protein
VTQSDPEPEPTGPTPADSLADIAATLRRVEGHLERMARAVVALAQVIPRGPR